MPSNITCVVIALLVLSSVSTIVIYCVCVRKKSGKSRIPQKEVIQKQNDAVTKPINHPNLSDVDDDVFYKDGEIL